MEETGRLYLMAHSAMGARVFIDGFETAGGRMIARKTSIQGTDLADWPADTPLALRPAPDARRS